MWAGLALSAIGAISQAQQSERAGKAAAETARKNTEIAYANQANAEQLANNIKKQTYSEEDLMRKKFRQMQGQQISTIGVSGLEFSGSMLDLYDQSVLNQETDIINARAAGLQQSKNALMQASNYGMQAEGLLNDSINARVSGQANAASSYMQAASYGMQSYTAYNNTNINTKKTGGF